MQARIILLTVCVAGYPVLGHAGPRATPTSHAGDDQLVVSTAPVLAETTASATATARQTRDAGERVGIERLVQVDGRLFRGSQPDAQGLRYLQSLGIRTIVSLRNTEDELKSVQQERKEVEALGMTFVNIPITMSVLNNGADASRQKLTQFLGVVDDAANGKVFIHCRRGADRTGTFVGLYRMVRQGWDADRAYAEARQVGMRFWYPWVKDQLKVFATYFPATPVATDASLPPK
jgi:protein tyrosine phosphatase (PTP) superfamily phosphohydrolase (DUF442 family)